MVRVQPGELEDAAIRVPEMHRSPGRPAFGLGITFLRPSLAAPLGQTADDSAGVTAVGWHRLRASDDARAEVRLDRLARLRRCGQLNLVDVIEARPLDGDDVAMHLSPIVRRGEQGCNFRVRPTAAGETYSLGATGSRTGW